MPVTKIEQDVEISTLTKKNVKADFKISGIVSLNANSLLKIIFAPNKNRTKTYHNEQKLLPFYQFLKQIETEVGTSTYS